MSNRLFILGLALGVVAFIAAPYSLPLTMVSLVGVLVISTIGPSSYE